MKMSLKSMLFAVICGFVLLLGAPSAFALALDETAELPSIVLAMGDDDDTDTDEGDDTDSDEDDDTDDDEDDTDDDTDTDEDD